MVSGWRPDINTADALASRDRQTGANKAHFLPSRMGHVGSHGSEERERWIVWENEKIFLTLAKVKTP